MPFVITRSEDCKSFLHYWLEFCSDMDVSDEALASSPQPPVSQYQTVETWMELPFMDAGQGHSYKKAVCQRNPAWEVFRIPFGNGFLWTMMPHQKGKQ